MRNMAQHLILAVSVIIVTMKTVWASMGDRSYIYQKCLQHCAQSTCSAVTTEQYAAHQPVSLRLLRWTCVEECKYSCMWYTLDAFNKDGSGVPQFYGKWPFIRLWGIQEPASTFFSLLNGLMNLIMLMRFRRAVPSSAPMYYIWHFYGLVAINAWFWAVVFHTRDFDFTEMMDYFCAISLVLTSLFVLCVRLLGPHNWWKWSPVAVAIISFFMYHVHYLAFVSFDYGYNMQANVIVGSMSGIGWITWYIKVKRKQQYVWKAAAVVIAVNVLVLLELLDFPPLWWTFDAHSLWHLGTAPLPILWFSFVIDDCHFMLRQKSALSAGDTNHTPSSNTKKDA